MGRSTGKRVTHLAIPYMTVEEPLIYHIQVYFVAKGTDHGYTFGLLLFCPFNRASPKIWLRFLHWEGDILLVIPDGAQACLVAFRARPISSLTIRMRSGYNDSRKRCLARNIVITTSGPSD